MPLVHLALSEPEVLGYVLDKLPLPVGVSAELSLEHAQLLLVFPLSPFDVATSRMLILLVFEERGHAVVQVVVLELVAVDVEEPSKEQVVLSGRFEVKL